MRFILPILIVLALAGAAYAGCPVCTTTCMPDGYGGQVCTTVCR